MSLITRCPACGTMFKVVTDQLKVSSGWVRCGQCAEVFDASAYLQQVAPGQTPVGAEVSKVVHTDQPLASPSAASNDNTDNPAAPDIAAGPDTDDGLTSTGIPSPALTLREPEAPWSPAASFADRTAHQPGSAASDNHQGDTGADSGNSGFDPMGWKHNMLAAAAKAASPPAEVLASINADASADLADPLPTEALDDSNSTVSFVRDARRKAFWRTPGIRALLAITGLLLAVLLVFQVAVQQRDTLAALEPRLRPGLQTLCDVLGCELSPLRQIDFIVIDNSSFRKVGTDAYRLSFSIKNTGSLPLAMPSLEITLTDTQEQTLVRRVISPAQFGATGSLLPAGSSFAGLLAFDVAADLKAEAALSATEPAAPSNLLRIAGYRMLAFYP